ncbi:MAG: hypothetical protein M3300_09305 [Actinomycetota bacterium]|nr:hypothetical protein [Actinomycetota bacterium]
MNLPYADRSQYLRVSRLRVTVIGLEIGTLDADQTIPVRPWPSQQWVSNTSASATTHGHGQLTNTNR